MTGSVNLLHEIREVMPIGVALPNGKESVANKKGSVNWSKKIKLNNVLCAPDLCCNLILVGQISRDLNCFVTFYDDVCLLQDRTSRILTGVGEGHGGVYYVKGVLEDKV